MRNTNEIVVDLDIGCKDTKFELWGRIHPPKLNIDPRWLDIGGGGRERAVGVGYASEMRAGWWM